MKIAFQPVFCFCLILIMSSGLFSCTYREVEIVKFENASIKKISSKGLEAEVILKVKNPNNYNITIANSDLDIVINDKPLGKAKIAGKITFPKKSEAVHRILIESDFEKLGGGVMSMLASVMLSQSVNLGVKGDITARALFFRKKIKVDIKENVALMQK